MLIADRQTRSRHGQIRHGWRGHWRLRQGVLGDVQNLVREAGSSDGTLRRLLQDPGLAQKIDELLAQALRQIPRLDRIIRDAETFADKIARHPELLGVGGAVRPGNGLKEPPARPMGTLPGFPPGDLRPMPVSP
jgi:phospholipid/cholesterol/gamma-HCH transport system substrate-binding protein